MSALLNLALHLVESNPGAALNVLQALLDVLKSNPNLLIDLVNHFKPKQG